MQEYTRRDLASLKRAFARVARQNLFPVYRPRLSTFSVTASAALSATASPSDDIFRHSFSPAATFVVVFSSSRLAILDIRGPEPQVHTSFQIRQKPSCVEISDDGTTLAVLTSGVKLKIFDLCNPSARRSHSFTLDEPAVALALSPDSTLLAASQARGIELFALSDPEEHARRRVVGCEAATHLFFARNGRLLLSTHTRLAKASTTAITAPEDVAAVLPEVDGNYRESTASAWMSRPLFPSAFGKTTHASLLSAEDGLLIAYDEPAQSFGILNSQQMLFAYSLLTVPQAFVYSSSLPSVTAGGDIAAIPFSHSGIRILALSDLATEDEDSEKTSQQSWIPFREPLSQVRWQWAEDSRQRLFAVGSGASSTVEDLTSGQADEQRESGSIFTFEFGCHVEAIKGTDTIVDLSTARADILETEADEVEAVVVPQSVTSRPTERSRNIPLARSVTAARRKLKARFMPGPEIREQPQAGSSPVDSVIEGHLARRADEKSQSQSQSRPQPTSNPSTVVAQREREPPRYLANRPPQLRRIGAPNQAFIDPRGPGSATPPPPPYDAREPRAPQPRGTHLPPVQPERSPRRPRLSVSTSTPDLKATASKQMTDSSPEEAAGRTPNKLQRPSSKRMSSAFGSARNSVVAGTQNVRRALSTNPAVDDRPSSSSKLAKDVPFEKTRARPVSVSVEPQMPVREKRRSLLQRPLSIASPSEIRPSNRRSVSHPLPLTSSSDIAPVPPPFAQLHAPDSPTMPSSEQMARFHRRQTSSSVSSLNSNAPRAAMGAVRSGTNPNSPWASSTMLATLAEGQADSGADEPSSTAGFRPGPGHKPNRSFSTPAHLAPGSATRSGVGTATPPRRLHEARASLNSLNNGDQRRPRPVSYGSMDDRPLSSDSNHAAANGNGSHLPGSRLSTVQSETSAGSPEKKRSESASRGSGKGGVLRRASSTKIGGAAVGVKVEEAGRKGKGTGTLSRWRKSLFGSLSSV